MQLHELKNDIEVAIRDLAKSNYYQIVFSNTKENPFFLFENGKDFTKLQLIFLGYLNFYNTINTDIATGEVRETVKNNPIYEDAYFEFRSKKYYKKEIKKQEVKKPEITSVSNFVFRKPNKKV